MLRWVLAPAGLPAGPELAPTQPLAHLDRLLVQLPQGQQLAPQTALQTRAHTSLHDRSRIQPGHKFLNALQERPQRRAGDVVYTLTGERCVPVNP